ncbi:Tryptophan synthase beta subunit-like PLP-dependent enzyme protein [Raphanus sativus]|nr:Tryptophan synthase beta subunit-like PLP-dependent enzyme protein [Raphanus sativus]
MLLLNRPHRLLPPLLHRKYHQKRRICYNCFSFLPNDLVGAVRQLGNQVKKGDCGCYWNTLLIRINSLFDATGCEILGKCEFLNSGGSVKVLSRSFNKANAGNTCLCPFDCQCCL